MLVTIEESIMLLQVKVKSNSKFHVMYIQILSTKFLKMTHYVSRSCSFLNYNHRYYKVLFMVFDAFLTFKFKIN